jgi:SAM-dependent methyltransferase
VSNYVQYGAGLSGPEEWSNFDASPSLQIQRLPLIGSLFKKIGPSFPATIHYGDIVKGLPIAPNSLEAIYCSHVLEHLSLQDFRLALSNTLGYLKPGGRFRLVLPDLEILAQGYLHSAEHDAALKFMTDTYLGHYERSKGLLGLLRSWLGNSAHLWMWDYKSIKVELEKAGFVNIRRAEFGDSGDPMFNLVEDLGRWQHNLGVDCEKSD